MKGLAIQRVDALLNAHEDGSYILSIEWRTTTEEDVENDPTCPIINLFSIFSIDHLWSKIHGRSFRLIFKLFLFEDLRNTKIDQFDALDIILLF